MRFRLVAFFLLLITFTLFFTTVQTTRKKIGEPFPGFLAFENGLVGAFYLPDWPGARAGLSYHDRLPTTWDKKEAFTRRDFVLTVLFPSVAGLFFVLLGTSVALFFQGGRWPLLLFHFLVGNYLVLSPDFHLTYRFSYLLLFFFAFIPASMVHFALLFPEPDRRARPLAMAAYGVCLLVSVPYAAAFLSDVDVWASIEYGVVTLVIASYFFWIAQLIRSLRHPHLEFHRIIARYLLLGQVVAFTIPFLAVMAVFVGRIPLPLNLAAPFTLLFPLALFIGVILGRLRQSQMQLVQSEKMATLGNLMAGLAHELKNPLTFVYSNIEPLKERIARLKDEQGVSGAMIDDLEGIVQDMEEGAVRARGIVDDFRFFAYPGRKDAEAVDLNDLLDHAIRLLTPKWKERIKIERRFGVIPKFRGSPGEIAQLFVNLIANACEAIDIDGIVTVETERRDGWLRITVRDTGGGISRDRLSRIFDPFYTTKRQGEGTGLGLAIAQQIVRAHGGTIEAKSEVGKGSEFVVTLPI